jgi:hypothetical protein
MTGNLDSKIIHMIPMYKSTLQTRNTDTDSDMN